MSISAQIKAQDDEWLTPKEAAAILRVVVHTLAVWRCTKRYPLPYHKPYGKVLYKKEEVLEFKNSGRVVINV